MITIYNLWFQFKKLKKSKGSEFKFNDELKQMKTTLAATQTIANTTNLVIMLKHIKIYNWKSVKNNYAKFESDKQKAVWNINNNSTDSKRKVRVRSHLKANDFFQYFINVAEDLMTNFVDRNYEFFNTFLMFTSSTEKSLKCDTKSTSKHVFELASLLINLISHFITAPLTLLINSWI